ncbi:hypothetical protein HWV62_12026 [Athelia sp. TMB]|nr:hypothetical protein HWV62_12026 [Athelia sp. TMB]
MTEEMNQSPPAKRRRMPAANVVISHKVVTGPYWFIDGDFILRVEDYQFKIHHKRLECSEIFSDMLALPQPTKMENIDGCAFVDLADSAADWMAVLEWIYEPGKFLKRPHVFATLSAALRISTKYEIPLLREWCLADLRSRWPRELEDMGSTSLAHAAELEAISLARECDVPEILPAAFYILSVQKWSASAEGGRSHITLSPSDLRRVIVGRERLNEVTLNFAIDPVPEAYARLICDSCRPQMERFWRSMLTPKPAKVSHMIGARFVTSRILRSHGIAWMD